ncbi:MULTISPECIES: SemiSWEET transporter [unclassified Kaistella]|uniref:SemiSWEET transporter n=1 Tax=unclassified Kaistella TaxID=2762626 RepID=UPI0027331DEF|nr:MULTISPECIES: SemiSWEET transporter [unclassified Kaistella]MCZ2083875.1 SemiSWEET transporter [Flavobacteriales bacterium]MDP2454494.1 SemiSWEET transporter [Kaistella sp. SH11-4b]MDP2457232.1 SemiSWEET transporter [Kaistella sp. SH40-3]MDP2459992.1 SemiSWEET transporter [Kaistella sp. SH19-2b]
MNENILGLVAGGITSVAMLPQLIKVLKEKDVKDLSLLMILFLITGLSLWVWYGFIKDELPIILSNAFAVLVNVSLLISYFIYRKK